MAQVAPRYAPHPTSPVRVHRVAQGMSQEALAERAGVGRNTVSRLERRIHAPTPRTLEALAAALGVDVQQLFPPEDRSGTNG